MSYKTVVDAFSGEIIEKKSRFIGKLYPVSSEAEVKEIIGKLRKEHHQANHCCSAFRLHTQPLVERYSDDGEPSGTAGMPMLEVIRGCGLENVLVVAIRYFGGTKLGTGGLVRAYTQAAQGALEQAEVVEVGTFCPLIVEVPYPLSGKVAYHIEQNNYLLDEVTYGEQVAYGLYVAKDRVTDVESEFVELTSDTCEILVDQAIDGFIRNGCMVTGDKHE